MDQFKNLESIEVQDIFLELDKIKILKNLNLKIHNSGIHCLLGPNGSGKTITNKVLGLLLSPQKGRMLWNNIELDLETDRIRSKLIRQIGFLHQNPIFIKGTVLENLELPLKIRNLPKESIKSQISELVKTYQLDDLSQKQVSKLSQGQRQKVALIRSIIHNPKLLILDEPTSSLDNQNTKWIEELILNLTNDSDVIVVWTTHDHFQVKRIATTVSILIDGKIEDTGDVNRVFNQASNKLVKEYLEGKLV